jgi:hypothetical protein
MPGSLLGNYKAATSNIGGRVGTVVGGVAGTLFGGPLGGALGGLAGRGLGAVTETGLGALGRGIAMLLGHGNSPVTPSAGGWNIDKNGNILPTTPAASGGGGNGGVTGGGSAGGGIGGFGAAYGFDQATFNQGGSPLERAVYKSMLG